MNEENQVQPAFIPVTLIKRKRFGKMVFNAIPGFILLISVIGSQPPTIGALLMNVACVLSGAAVIFFSYREYRNPGKGKWFGTDSVSVFTGLMIIAQGSMIFEAPKGFQPAHLLFVAAAVYIFKGVMLPDAQFKKGIIVSKEDIVFRLSPFRKKGPVPVADIREVRVEGTTLVFTYNDANVLKLDISEAENPETVLEQLRNLLVVNV